MSFVCLSGLTGPEGPINATDLSVALIEQAPKILADQNADGPSAAEPLLWADARGLQSRSLAQTLIGVLLQQGCQAPRAGVAATAIAARVAGGADHSSAFRGRPGLARTISCQGARSRAGSGKPA